MCCGVGTGAGSCSWIWRCFTIVAQPSSWVSLLGCAPSLPPTTPCLLRLGVFDVHRLAGIGHLLLRPILRDDECLSLLRCVWISGMTGKVNTSQLCLQCTTLVDFSFSSANCDSAFARLKNGNNCELQLLELRLLHARYVA